MFRQALQCRCSIQRSFSISAVHLSGHNKWSKIKAKKGVMDAQKSKIYGKAARDIMVAARTGGSADPDSNASLAAALKAARVNGVPKANVESALKKASGGKEQGGNQIALFEAMAHGSVGIMIECLTDNSNRTIHKLREILNRHNSRFAPVGFLFERKGLVRVSLDKTVLEDIDSEMERVFDVGLKMDVEDFNDRPSEENEESHELEFICIPQDLTKVTEALMKFDGAAPLNLLTQELIYVPKSAAVEADEVLEGKISNLVEDLEENEDVLRVYTSLDS